MAKTKTSKASLDDIAASPRRVGNKTQNFFEEIENPIKLEQQVQEAQYVQDRNNTQQVQVVQEVQEEIKRAEGFRQTQGKKGQKLKRINMAFTDANHDYITHESRRRGISSTAFVNQIIDEYKVK